MAGIFHAGNRPSAVHRQTVRQERTVDSFCPTTPWSNDLMRYGIARKTTRGWCRSERPWARVSATASPRSRAVATVLPAVLDELAHGKGEKYVIELLDAHAIDHDTRLGPGQCLGARRRCQRGTRNLCSRSVSGGSSGFRNPGTCGTSRGCSTLRSHEREG